jgi:hypothetical protein
MRYRGEKALRFLLDDVDAELDANWQGSSGQILGCGLDAKEWSAFFPDYAAYSYKAGFGQQMGRYWCYVFRNWNDDEKPLVMPTILWAELLMQLRYIVCYEHTVFLSERPVVWSFDPTDRLHCESGPAIKFKDGYSQYFWRGLNVDAWVIEDEPTLENIEKAWNIEVRRVLIERCGLQKYLFDSGAKVIHKDEWGTLYRKEMERDEPILMLHVVNKTAEPDGSFKDYFLRVPPTMQTAHEAVAWTFDLDAQSYHPRQET